jgi:predicted dehydrogenase
MAQVNWGVIGAGGIAMRRTLPGAVQDAKRAKFVALMDIREQAAREAAKQFGVSKVYATQRELLADSEVQAVYIATPVNVHLPQIEAAARAGKHVLVEKPVALNAAEGERAIEACRKAGVLLGCGYMMRFHSLNVAARDLVARGDLGRIVAGRAQLTCWYPRIAGAWRQDPEKGGGGAWLDLGSHAIDLLEFISGSRVASVYALNQTLVQDYAVEDTSTVLLRMENGAQMIVDSLFNVPDAASRGLLEIYGTRGALYGQGTIGQTPGGRIRVILSDQGQYDAQQERTPTEETFDLQAEPVNMYAAEIEQFSRAILEGGQPAVDGEEALWNLKIIEACYRSGRERREVPVQR